MSESSRDERQETSTDMRRPRRRLRRKPDHVQPLPQVDTTSNQAWGSTSDELERRDAEVAELFNKLFPVDPVTGRIGESLIEFKLGITPDDLVRKDAEVAAALDRFISHRPGPKNPKRGEVTKEN